jgi:hypothetical protein
MQSSQDNRFRLSEEDYQNVNLCYHVPKNLQKNKPGYCIIFNQKSFHPSLKKSSRDGTDLDCSELERTFSRLGFKVDYYTDYTCSEVKEKCRKISHLEEKLKELHCFVMIVLTHGEGDGKLFFNDGKLALDDLLFYFKGDKCAPLLGKPKLFFIQACRGKNMDPGTQLKTEAGKERFIVKIPIESDILIHQSTAPGYLAWRQPECGSWFIEHLCAVLNKHAKKEELIDMLTVVNRKVAYLCQSRTTKEDTNEMKQMPSITNQLTRKFYFFPRSQ